MFAFFGSLLAFGCALNQSQPHRFFSGYTSRERKLAVSRSATLLCEVHDLLEDRQPSKVEAAVLQRLIVVAKEPDLNVVRDAAQEFLEARPNENSMGLTLQSLLPLIFEPAQRAPDGSRIAYPWVPFQLVHGRLHYLHGLRGPSVWEFFSFFDTRRDYSAQRTDLAKLKY